MNPSRYSYWTAVYLPIFLVIALASWWLGNQGGEPVKTTSLFFAATFFTGFLHAAINLYGLIRYGWEPLREEDVPSLKTIRGIWVSRGKNLEALRHAVEQSIENLEAANCLWEVEIITDTPVDLGIKAPVTYISVPEDYTPLNGAKWKARALEYARTVRKCTGALNLHCDEESVITTSLVQGIKRFTPKDFMRAIGQGLITYRKEHWFFAAIDAVRAGDDLGRFRAQYHAFKKPLFGMHGSFVLVLDYLENVLSWDLGGKGSVTEDAYFALKAAERGIEFYWVEGNLLEQSPQNLMDLMQQRRRWFTGLRLLVTDASIHWKTRLPLRVSVLMWTVSWISVVCGILSLLMSGSYVGYLPGILLALILSVNLSVYAVGAVYNRSNPFLAVLLAPVSGIVEASSVLWALVKPAVTFHVVDKRA